MKNNFSDNLYHVSGKVQIVKEPSTERFPECNGNGTNADNRFSGFSWGSFFFGTLVAGISSWFIINHINGDKTKELGRLKRQYEDLERKVKDLENDKPTNS